MSFAPDRRDALKLLAMGATAALGACGPPEEEIVPYVEMPEGLTPGVPMQFTTALPLSGYARGVLVTSYEGRPTRIEGNPRHPASLGACDIFAQAEIMTLYNPDRAKAVLNEGNLSSWEDFEKALLSQMQIERGRRGSKLTILTGRVTSPTMVRQIQALLKSFPGAQWRRYEPIHDDAEISGATMAFGRPLLPIPRLDQAAVVVSLDADPLGPGPYQLAYAYAFAQKRLARKGVIQFGRLYAVESCLSLTGANSDERLALPPHLIRGFIVDIANRLGAKLPQEALGDDASRFAAAVVEDLKANPGHGVILVGRGQPAEMHALCHWINRALKAPVDYFPPVDPVASTHVDSLRGLVEDIDNGRVESLFIIGCNPAYAAPGELAVDDAIAKVPFSAYHGLYDDETAARCKWRLPLSHTLESWSDLRALDGAVSVVQPLIRPLYDTRTAHQLLALMGGMLSASSYQLVRETSQARAPRDFETHWRQWLHDGIIQGSANAPLAPPNVTLPNIDPLQAPRGPSLTFAPDPSIWDGSYANNAWLQECPKPTTKEVWGNSIHISPSDAAANDLEEGDIVTLRRGEHSLEAPVNIVQGQAAGVLGATLGYGRRRAGAIGEGLGFDAYKLMPIGTPWAAHNVALSRTGARSTILRTQRSFHLAPERKEIYPTVTLQGFTEGNIDISERRSLPTLLPEWEYDSYKWAMSIDNTLCIGCNACLVACRSENNVPVVGPIEVSMGREMHWLRVDVYYRDEPTPLGFQPVPCMHCEKAPCEPVCPVEASVHDSEGLNVQVYNRCIGTRFCQSNCPYKVRRFNFFGYATDDVYANLHAQSFDAQFNPDVTVRSRGVMEKCTYCLQRISRARRTAEKENRRIAEGEIVTACQAACPTRAIIFGDLSNADGKVSQLRNEPQHYEMLGHLGTRPRTTYLAAIENPNPALREKEE
ncbi:MAG: 4Fe-4S dicluster domain-containing protein [Methylocystis sp.]